MPLIVAADIPGAFGLLTRLPLGGPGRGAASAWAWPIAGAVVGALGGAAGAGLAALGAPAGVAAAAALAVMALATGALHEDGLADTADGLFGGRDARARLAIMQDSRVGSFGALALVLVTLARWSAGAALLAGPPGPAIAALVAAGALSRAPMAAVMAALPFARAGGMAAALGRPGWPTVAAGAAAALAVAVPCAGAGALPAAAAAALAAALVARAAARRIGGQTGDILGAAQQLGEAAALATLAAR